jgi:hypothetical protein
VSDFDDDDIYEGDEELEQYVNEQYEAAPFEKLDIPKEFLSDSAFPMPSGEMAKIEVSTGQLLGKYEIPAGFKYDEYIASLYPKAELDIIQDHDQINVLVFTETEPDSEPEFLFMIRHDEPETMSQLH